MTTAKERLIEKYKARPDNGSEVPYTKELERVLTLPLRNWEEEMKRTQLHLKMTTAYKQPHGKQILRPIQGAAIAELHDNRGLLAPIGVGLGKTLISFLAPLVLAVHRPLVLVPASLKEKTYREFAALRMHWIGHPTLRVESYEILSNVGGEHLLTNYQPDMLICDEVHRLKNLDAAVTRRVLRYMQAYPNTIFAGMSGSIMKRSVMDFWHLALFALRDKMPLPNNKDEAEMWAEVLDAEQFKEMDFLGTSRRRKPGALMIFCEDLNEDDVFEPPPTDAFTFKPDDGKRERARLGYQKRFRSTPGVVCSGAEELDCSLTIECLHWPMGEKSKEAVKVLKTTGYTPSGDLLSERATIWLASLEMAAGFYYRWDPPAPMDWLTARRNWNANVRAILEKHIPGIDSALQVQQALTLGKYVDKVALQSYEEWAAIKGSFEPNPVAEWLDQDIIERCAAWMRKTKGIVWVAFQAVGEQLSRVSGAPYCGEQGTDAQGRPLESFAGAAVIASVASNSTGRNLQAWNQNLVTTPLSNALGWEQLLGRTHRQGQKADNVTYSWINSCQEHQAAFDQSLYDARTISTTVGPSRQRLLYADHIGFDK